MRSRRTYRPRHAGERPDPVWKRPSDAPVRSGVRIATVGGVLVAGLAGALLPGTSFAATGGAASVAVSAPAALGHPVILLGARSTPVTARPMQPHLVAQVDSTARRAFRLAPAVPMITLATASKEVAMGLDSIAVKTAAQDTAIPASAFAAYHAAEVNLAQSNAGCHLPWWILAGVGRIESGHAAEGRVDADGTTLGPILSAAPTSSTSSSFVADTDGGAYDHSASYDRAVGPMQIMPAVWSEMGQDGNGDGLADPDNIFDSATTAGALMCSVGGNLSQPRNLAKALLSMDGSTAYVQSVVSWGVAYRASATVTDNATGLVPTVPQEQQLTVIPLVSADGQTTLPKDDGTVSVPVVPVDTPTQDPTLPLEPLPAQDPTTQAPTSPTQDPTAPPPSTDPTTQPQPTSPATQEPAPPASTEPSVTTPPPAPADPVPPSTTTTSDPPPAQVAPSSAQDAPSAAQAPAAATQTAASSPLAAAPASTAAAAPAATVDAAP